MLLQTTLIPLSALCGIFTALVFRRFASAGTRQTVNRIRAHMMELRLFLDEPSLIAKAQWDLLRENLRLFRQIAVPTLITAPVLALVMWQADAIYGRAPLRAGEPVVVTASANTSDARLEAPPDVVVETPAVRIPRLHQVSWRIRPLKPFSGRLTVNGNSSHIDVPWLRANVFGLSWIVWFFGISSISALLAPRLIRRSAAPIAILILSAHSASAAEKTPVILISIDTLRADHLSAYGYTKIRTPNIDSLAAGGTIYQRIDSQIPLTLPSHTVLMTSTYPFQNRVEANTEIVPPGSITLASILRADGYQTAAFIGSMILDRRYGLDQGFDFYDSPFETAPGSIANQYSARVRRDASLVTRAARQWIDRNKSEPFFAFLHFYDLHTPYTLPQVAGLTPSVAGYDAELLHVDQAIGGLRDALVREGVWDKALVILLADHGEGLGDHGETSHGYFIYESTMHVPLIVHWPAGAAKFPERIAQPGGLIDVAPTILDFLHIAAAPSFEGTSLLPGHGDRMPYGESVYPQENFGWAALRSMQAGQFKYIDAPKPELYDLVQDPGERTNILRAHPEEAQALKARKDALMARYTPKPPAAAPGISADTRHALGSLGYTSGGRRTAQVQPPDPKDKLAEQEAYESGLTALYTGLYSKAILTLQRIVAQDARNLPALCALGEAWLRSGNPTRALSLWQQALEHDPKYQPAADSIGGYWLAMKDYDKACRFLPSAPQCAGRK
jgi:arylsulfatase A-like enzyme